MTSSHVFFQVSYLRLFLHYCCRPFSIIKKTRVLEAYQLFIKISSFSESALRLSDAKNCVAATSTEGLAYERMLAGECANSLPPDRGEEHVLIKREFEYYDSLIKSRYQLIC